MLEIIIILCVVACIAWIVWKVRANIRASEEAALDEAWHEVLKDPNYMDRRRYEERKLEEKMRRKIEGAH